MLDVDVGQAADGLAEVDEEVLDLLSGHGHRIAAIVNAQVLAAGYLYARSHFPTGEKSMSQRA